MPQAPARCSAGCPARKSRLANAIGPNSTDEVGKKDLTRAQYLVSALAGVARLAGRNEVLKRCMRFISRAPTEPLVVSPFCTKVYVAAPSFLRARNSRGATLEPAAERNRVARATAGPRLSSGPLPGPVLSAMREATTAFAGSARKEIPAGSSALSSIGRSSPKGSQCPGTRCSGS